ncbi:hypothetical protein P7C70_g483, partial [Phenoliferia sp. Uapishka_3]
MIKNRVSTRALSRAFSTSKSSFAPATPPQRPTFTTPQPTPAEYAKEDLSKPLPPTDLPIEDYASPLLHTASSIGTFFRYAVYTSVGVVVLTLGAFAGVHVWVEKVELAGAARDDDPHHWAEDLDGWSGAYRGGGTDPRLGLRARMAIRSAWIGQSWGGGIATSAVPTSAGAGAGGAMIGAPRSNAGREVGDAGWQMAEGYLVYAIDRATKRGISLSVNDPASNVCSVDRAALELEERLAGVRERIGGRYKLEEARAGWEKVYYALSSTSDAAGWIKRERLRATKKLGEISARIASLEPEGSSGRTFQNTKAEGWFLGGLLPALTEAVGSTEQLDTPSKSISPSASFFAFWSRSHPPSRPSSLPSYVRPELEKLGRLVDQAATIQTLDPATSRAILTALVSLETFLARTRNLAAAEAIQRSSLSLASSLHLSPAFSSEPDITTLKVDPSSKTQRVLPWSTPSWLSPTLGQLHLLTRTSLVATHLAEVSLAQRQPEPEAFLRLQGAINDCDVIISALESSPLLNSTTGLSRLLPSKTRRELEVAASSIVRDARLTGAMAARLTGYVHEAGCGSISKKKKRSAKQQLWCGGDASALAFYARAMELSGSSEGSAGKVVDDKGYSEAEAGFRRAQKALQEQEAKLVKT